LFFAGVSAAHLEVKDKGRSHDLLFASMELSRRCVFISQPTKNFFLTLSNSQPTHLLLKYTLYFNNHLNKNNMEEYALIMRHEDGRKVASPEQIQQWMKQTMDWIGGIAAQNKFVSGTGLPFDNAKVITTRSGKPVVTNGPFGDIKETIGGFIVVRAESVEEAVEFAKACPVLQGEGNSMEVRKIAKGEGAQ
jgi:hypothetical protein